MRSVFIHEKAIVEEGAQLGEGTRVWAFAHILPGAVVGAGCNICDHTFIENDVRVGDRVTVKSGVFIWDGVRIGDDVFIGPNVTFTNEKYPGRQNRPEKYVETVVEAQASVGANATILPGLTIGRKAMVGAGAVVTRNVPPYAIVVGSPACIVGWVDKEEETCEPEDQLSVMKMRPRVVQNELKTVNDKRGALVELDFEQGLPFVPKRLFYIFGVPSGVGRGGHAHKECHQFLVCLKGSVTLHTDDGSTRREYVLDKPNTGLYLPPPTWGRLTNFSADAVLMVLASHPYDAGDYIRDQLEFLEYVKAF
ncbi:isomerase [bacterium]|nr:MAG: isomerase [bacterium]